MTIREYRKISQPQQNFRGSLDPTPDQIAAEAAKIRAEWPEERLLAMGVWCKTAVRKEHKLTGLKR